MDRASQVLAQNLSPGVRRTYAALAERSNVARSTLHHRARGRRSKEEQNQSQQYLTPSEEKAVIKFVLHILRICTAPQEKERSPRRTFSQDGQRAVCFHSTLTEYSETCQNEILYRMFINPAK